MKGKKHPLVDEDDVIAMYTLYKGKRNVLLWCYLLSTGVAYSSNCVKKRKRVDDEVEAAPKSKRVINQKKIQEVEDIVAQLKEKHGNEFKVEHLNAWAHLIHIGNIPLLILHPTIPTLLVANVPRHL